MRYINLGVFIMDDDKNEGQEDLKQTVKDIIANNITIHQTLIN